MTIFNVRVALVFFHHFTLLNSEFRNTSLTIRLKSEYIWIMALHGLSQRFPFLSSSGEDWPRDYIIAELHRRGLTLSQLSIENGYVRDSVREALDRPYPKCEAIIGRALKVSPSIIWPTRYRKRRRAAKKQQAGVGVTL
jgi:Ner family transcriptional regulator